MSDIRLSAENARAWRVDIAVDVYSEAAGVAVINSFTLHDLLPQLSKGSSVNTSNVLELLQWPAMVVTVAASWFVTSHYKDNRWLGFALFLASNLLWVIWGMHTGATALVVLQVCLAVLNVVGMRRTTATTTSEKNSISQQSST